MPLSAAQQLPLFLAGQINKAVLCTILGNVKRVNPILQLLYCGRHLPVPSSWPLLRGSRHSGSECSNVAADIYRKRVAYLLHMSINTTTTHEHTIQNWLKITVLWFSMPCSLVGMFRRFRWICYPHYTSWWRRQAALKSHEISVRLHVVSLQNTFTAVGITSFTKLTDWLTDWTGE